MYILPPERLFPGRFDQTARRKSVGDLPYASCFRIAWERVIYALFPFAAQALVLIRTRRANGCGVAHNLPFPFACFRLYIYTVTAFKSLKKRGLSAPFSCFVVADITILLDQTCVLVWDRAAVSGSNTTIRVIVEHRANDWQTEVCTRHGISDTIQR